MTVPRIGTLRRRVLVEAPVSTPDGAGGATLAWMPLTGIWARIETVRGAETLDRGQHATDALLTIWIRWRADINASMRLSEGSRRYEIVATDDPDGRRRWLRLTAIEERK